MFVFDKVIFIGCGMFSYSISSMALILQKFNETSKVYKHNSKVLTQYMDNRNVDITL